MKDNRTSYTFKRSRLLKTNVFFYCWPLILIVHMAFAQDQKLDKDVYIETLKARNYKTANVLSDLRKTRVDKAIFQKLLKRLTEIGVYIKGLDPKLLTARQHLLSTIEEEELIDLELKDAEELLSTMASILLNFYQQKQLIAENYLKVSENEKMLKKIIPEILKNNPGLTNLLLATQMEHTNLLAMDLKALGGRGDIFIDGLLLIQVELSYVAAQNPNSAKYKMVRDLYFNLLGYMYNSQKKDITQFNPFILDEPMAEWLKRIPTSFNDLVELRISNCSMAIKNL